MTTRYLTTDQNGNGDQTYWDINGYFLHGPSGEKLNLGGGNTTVTASNEIVQIGRSYLRIPQGISNERPNPSYAGMIRYLTSENLIEYYNASDLEWQSIGIGAPSITSVSPTILNQGTNNTISLTGKRFTQFSNIQLIGTDSSIFIPDTVNNTLGSTNLTFTCLSGNTILDNSSVEPFYIKVTNSDTGFSGETSPILNINQGSFFILPPGPNLGTFPVQDPCANFDIQGGDTDHPNGNDVSFAIVSANPTPGGFVLTNTSDISATFAPASGSRTDASAQTYNFSCQMTDTSGAKSVVQSFNFTLANPNVTSIVPSIIEVGTPVDLSVNGNYFVIDSSVSYVRQSDGSVVTPNTTTYNSITSLETNVTFSNGGVYDISVNNGSVYKLYTSVLTILTVTIFSYTQTSGTTLTPTISYEDSGKNPSGGPVIGGYTVVKFVPTSTDYTQNYQWDISFSNTTTISEILVVGGGGCGSNDTNNNQGNGGGGAGGFRETNSLAQSFTQGTNYVVQCGRPGQQNPTGAQTWANGQTTINTAPSLGDTARAAYASGISTGSTNIYVASGGGNGGYYNAEPGGNGGSGGGAGRGGTGGSGNIGSYSPSEGNNGVGSGSFGGGGGGAGAPASARNGGDGRTSTYFGGTYAGGGGGSGGGSYGSGGSGGGGSARATGNTSYQSGYWGTPGTGGGGGASDNKPSSPGGAGRVEFRFLSFA